jgi:AAA domain
MPESHPVASSQSLIQLADTPEDLQRRATPALRLEPRRFPRYEVFAPKLLREWRENPPAAVSQVVQGILADRMMTLLAGLQKMGKTTLAVDLAVHIARGGEWLGQEVARRPVLFISLEQYEGTTFDQFAKYGAWDCPISVHSTPVPPRLEEIEDYIHRPWYDPGLGEPVVILDSLTAFWTGGVDDENSATQTSKMLAPLQKLARAGCSVLVLHHASKSQHGRVEPRGSTAIQAIPDVVLTLGPKGKSTSTNRVLNGMGRLPGVPKNLHFKRTDTGSFLLCNPDVQEAGSAYERHAEGVSTALDQLGDGWWSDAQIRSQAEVLGFTKLPKRLGKEVLPRMQVEGLLEKGSEGSKNVYRLIRTQQEIQQ